MPQIWIQLLLLLGVAVVTVLLTRSTADARHQAMRRVLLVLFMLVAAASILYPQLVTKVANLLGIGRGTDFLLYLLIIAFLSFIATTFRRLRLMSRQLTTVTRELALLREELPPPPSTQPPPPSTK